MRADRGFTVIEIIVVIVIILVLAAILVPVVFIVRRKGNEAKCMSNMKQIHLELQMFRDDHISQGKELNPNWLNNLVWDNPARPDSDSNPGWDPTSKAHPLKDPEILICPLDPSRGKQGGKPDGPGIPQYDELDEYKYFEQNRPRAPLSSTATRDRRSSYMYEFNMAAECLDEWPWRSYIFDYMEGDGPTDIDAFVEIGYVDPATDRVVSEPNRSTWGEAKAAQLRHGDSWLNADPPGSGNYLPKSQWHGYANTRFPVLRCFWHTDNPNTNQPKISNLSYAGHVFSSGAKWEEQSLH